MTPDAYAAFTARLIDHLAPLRRFERGLPALGRELDAAPELPIGPCAGRLRAIARCELAQNLDPAACDTAARYLNEVAAG